MNTERIKAIITIVVTAVINIANILGYAWDADGAVNAILTIFSAVTIVYSWWKNQNITDEAIEAQKVLDQLKKDRRAKEE